MTIVCPSEALNDFDDPRKGSHSLIEGPVEFGCPVIGHWRLPILTHGRPETSVFRFGDVIIPGLNPRVDVSGGGIW